MWPLHISLTWELLSTRGFKDLLQGCDDGVGMTFCCIFYLQKINCLISFTKEAQEYIKQKTGLGHFKGSFHYLNLKQSKIKMQILRNVYFYLLYALGLILGFGFHSTKAELLAGFCSKLIRSHLGVTQLALCKALLPGPSQAHGGTQQDCFRIA